MIGFIKKGIDNIFQTFKKIYIEENQYFLRMNNVIVNENSLK